MNEAKKEGFGIGGWRIVMFLGSILLLLGNTLPWPCMDSLDGRGCTALKTFPLSDSWYGILLVVGFLLIPLEVSLLKSPLNYIVWCFFWFLIYLLIVAKLYPIYMDIEIWGYVPLIMINKDLGGPSTLVLPLSLITYWLTIRPINLQELLKFGAIVSLIILIILTSYFFILSELRVHQSADESYFSAYRVFGSGPSLTLIGGILLLGATFFEMRTDKIQLELKIQQTMV
jgi:hypothetical protein